ncbi:hypothetical protein FIM37_05650 [Helicobacter pylori]|nr:hypothetical protein FIM37_05650 [Helicobacter pylori]
MMDFVFFFFFFFFFFIFYFSDSCLLFFNLFPKLNNAYCFTHTADTNTHMSLTICTFIPTPTTF